MELRIEPAVVKRVGLSEYVFYYVSNVFRQIFLKTTLDKKIPLIYTEPVLIKFIIIAVFFGIALIIEWLLVARGRGLLW